MYININITCVLVLSHAICNATLHEFESLFPTTVKRAMSLKRATSSFLRRPYSIKPKSNLNVWDSVVGLEVHAQIQSKSKLFSPSGVDFAVPVNTLVSLFDAAVPGTLPVLNRRCVEAAVTTALALSCDLNRISLFDRKHYFYADMPAGYQITQQRKAIAQNGEIKFLVMDPERKFKPYQKSCRIHQLQLEQDSGKSLHDQFSDRSLIDLNRAGIALMEIVFKPDLSTGEEAASLVKELCLILQTLNACSCRMEEGALRVDANISVNKKGDGLGTRTEVKNISSIRSLASAIEYEIQRQIHVLEDGGTIVNETRSYDANRKMTLPMRDKEVQQDYRFMPEPNLPPLMLCDNPDEDERCRDNSEQVNIDTLRKRLVDMELPDDVRQRLVKVYALRVEAANTIVNTPGMTEYYMSVMKNISPTAGVLAANLLLTLVMEQLKDKELDFDQIPLKPDIVSEIVVLLESRQIQNDTAKKILIILFDGDKRSPLQIVNDEGWTMVSDERLIEEICKKVIENNPKVVSKFRSSQKSQHYTKLMNLTKNESERMLDMKKVSATMQRLLKSE